MELEALENRKAPTSMLSGQKRGNKRKVKNWGTHYKQVSAKKKVSKASKRLIQRAKRSRKIN